MQGAEAAQKTFKEVKTPQAGKKKPSFRLCSNSTSQSGS